MIHCRRYLLGLVLAFIAVDGHAQLDFATISERIKYQICSESAQQADLKNVVSFLPLLQKNGSWPDINYDSKENTRWKPGLHLDRVKSFAKVLIAEGGYYQYNEELWTATLQALRYWYSKNPTSNNWWHNEIASPQSLGEILILLQYSNMQMPASLKDSLVYRMAQGNAFEKTGANKLDIALHMIYRACLTKDTNLMQTAVGQAFQPIIITSEEGIQYDYSYLQHGQQLHISSYGLVFLAGEYKVASWVQGTSYALAESQRKVLDQYFLRTFLPSIRGRFIDFNTEGRGISRKDILDKGSLAAQKNGNSLLDLALQVSPENAAMINAAKKRITQQELASFAIQPSNKYYWKADYLQHLRPGFTFNVRTVSNRTKRTESGNKENLLGKYLSDGSTNIQRSGKEYYNIMPIWEWDKIPGTTARDFALDRQITVQWGEQGSTSYVGGVSDSKYGVNCYDMNYDSVQAKKAWFYFDKEVICLGAGIRSNVSENIVTTVNQCWLSGKAKLYADGKDVSIRKNHETANAKWLWHDSVGYFFLKPVSISVSAQIQKGSWSRINSSQQKDELEGEVFKLWLNHGAKPEDSSYAYSVVPGIAANEMGIYPSEQVSIISNTSKAQAVYHAGLDMLQIVFYEAGAVKMNEVYVAAEKPCVILIKNSRTKELIMHVADPSQKSNEVILTVKSELFNAEVQLNCKLPSGDLAGASAEFRVKI